VFHIFVMGKLTRSKTLSYNFFLNWTYAIPCDYIKMEIIILP